LSRGSRRDIDLTDMRVAFAPPLAIEAIAEIAHDPLVGDIAPGCRCRDIVLVGDIIRSDEGDLATIGRPADRSGTVRMIAYLAGFAAVDPDRLDLRLWLALLFRCCLLGVR